MYSFMLKTARIFEHMIDKPSPVTAATFEDSWPFTAPFPRAAGDAKTAPGVTVSVSTATDGVRTFRRQTLRRQCRTFRRHIQLHKDRIPRSRGCRRGCRCRGMRSLCDCMCRRNVQHCRRNVLSAQRPYSQPTNRDYFARNHANSSAKA